MPKSRTEFHTQLLWIRININGKKEEWVKMGKIVFMLINIFLLVYS